MASDDIRESRKLVRMYSWDAEERLPPGSDAHVLGQVLREMAGREDIQSLQPWRKFFDPDEQTDDEKNPITDVIAVESAKLRAKWVTFQQTCPKKEQLDLRKFEPTVDGVVDMVTSMTNAWIVRRDKGRWGKVTSRLRRFGCKLNSHKTLLEVLPRGNEYVSVFTGTITAIFQACANYDQIVEDLSSALLAISEHVADVETDQALFRTFEMLERIADLYAHIFLFLASTMDWLMEKRRRRMLDSFNETFSKRFSDELGTIQRRGELIRNLAEQSSRVELRATRLLVENMRQDVRIGLTATARQQAELFYANQRFMKEVAESKEGWREMKESWKQLADTTQQMAQGTAMKWLYDNRAASPGTPVRYIDDAEVLLHRSQTLRVVSQWTVKDISLSSRGLEDFFFRNRVRLAVDTFNIMVNPETLVRLSRWSETDSCSHMLWLEGPHIGADDWENPMTMMAAKYIDLAAQSGVPVMSYFCQLNRHERLRPGNTREVQAMNAMLYALLRQMIELFPPRLDTNADLTESRFQRLDGTASSWKDALSVFCDLLESIPDSVLCVLDGFQWLDDRSTDEHLKKLLQVLQGEKLKVLFTTTGRSACLRQALSGSETFVVETLH